MKLTRFKGGWSPLPMSVLVGFGIIAVLVSSPEHPNLGPGILLITIIITGLLEGIINSKVKFFQGEHNE